jgi:hypothetical protein
VGLNEPGQHVATPGVDDPIVTTVGVDTTDGFNSPIPNRHVARHDVEAIVHREDRAGADEK